MIYIDIKPYLTAIHRKKTSLPLNRLIEEGLLSKEISILDYGCGHGFDLSFLKEKDFKIVGYDKYIKKYSDLYYYKNQYDVILCIYVLNTIPTIEERINTIKDILSLLKPNGKAYIAVRSIDELNSSNKENLNTYNDGIITCKKTFQKYFSKEDLHSLISDNFMNISYDYIKINRSTLFIELTQKEVCYA